MQGDFRTEFVRQPVALKQFPALVLNADYRPLSYYPLSLWTWQEAVKASYLERVDIIAEYDQSVRSPSIEIQTPFRDCAEGLCEAAKMRGLHPV